MNGFQKQTALFNVSDANKKGLNLLGFNPLNVGGTVSLPNKPLPIDLKAIFYDVAANIPTDIQTLFIVTLPKAPIKAVPAMEQYHCFGHAAVKRSHCYCYTCYSCYTSRVENYIGRASSLE